MIYTNSPFVKLYIKKLLFNSKVIGFLYCVVYGVIQILFHRYQSVPLYIILMYYGIVLLFIWVGMKYNITVLLNL